MMGLCGEEVAIIVSEGHILCSLSRNCCLDAGLEGFVFGLKFLASNLQVYSKLFLKKEAGLL